MRDDTEFEQTRGLFRLLGKDHWVGICLLTTILVILPACSVEWVYPARANSVTALKQVRLLVKCESRFHQQRGRFASLQELGPGGLGCASVELASGVFSGYRFAVNVEERAYRIQAQPLHYGETGLVSLTADESGVIRESWTREQSHWRIVDE